MKLPAIRGLEGSTWRRTSKNSFSVIITFHGSSVPTPSITRMPYTSPNLVRAGRGIVGEGVPRGLGVVQLAASGQQQQQQQQQHHLSMAMQSTGRGIRYCPRRPASRHQCLAARLHSAHLQRPGVQASALARGGRLLPIMRCC
jgi:hypothetical protein